MRGLRSLFDVLSSGSDGGIHGTSSYAQVCNGVMWLDHPKNALKRLSLTWVLRQVRLMVS